MVKQWIRVADNRGFLFAVNDDCTIEYGPGFTRERALAAFEEQMIGLHSHRSGVGHEPFGPAIQNHPIAVIRSIHEETPEEGHHRRYMATGHTESESERLQADLEPIHDHGGES